MRLLKAVGAAAATLLILALFEWNAYAWLPTLIAIGVGVWVWKRESPPVPKDEGTP